MIKATIKSSELTKMFKQLGGNVGDLRPALLKIGGVLEAASETAFEREGPGWKSLKPGTLKRRKKQKKTGKKLQIEGGLVGSVSSQIIGGRTVVIGSNLEYAAPHQFGAKIRHPGTSKGFGKGIKIPPHIIPIPARPYLIVGEAEIRKSIFILSKHLLKGV